jgi:predicted nuclease of predicted toxin-antitoxin system
VKLLIDNCLSAKLGESLIAAGHDVESVSDWPADPGDRKILAIAARDGRILVTADRGFGELVVAARLRTAGLIVLHKIPAVEHRNACIRVLAEHSDELLGGGFVIVTGDRTRARAALPDA